MGSDNSNITRIQFFIPTLNNIDTIEETLQSIWNQNYDLDQIYISVMDFGSIDGTFEKLQEFPSYHLGIYQNRSTKNRRQMIGRLEETTKRLNPGGHYCFKSVLYPGEILSPDSTRISAKAIIERTTAIDCFFIWLLLVCDVLYHY